MRMNPPTSTSHPPPSPTIYWRFDDVAPKIRNAQTHYLTSIPVTHRLPPPRPVPSPIEGEHQAAATIDYEEYSSHEANTWPQKLHLYEVNPCIATLPLSYQHHLSIKGENPVYVVTYRVTHHNNCFDDGQTNLNLLGGSWEKALSLRTDYLGVALLRADLTILADTVVSFGGSNDANPLKRVFPKYDDYRVINLHEQLYLSTGNRIAPLYIVSSSVDVSKYKGDPGPLRNRDNVLEVPAAFHTPTTTSTSRTHKSSTSTNSTSPFRILVREFSACAVYGVKHDGRRKKKSSYNGSKNLLYFVDTHNRTMLVHYPRKNPNDVRQVDLDTLCGKQRITKYIDEPGATTPNASFQTIDELKYPLLERTTEIFMADRGSACCVRMTDPDTTRAVLVGVVHPKTVFPGKKLPPDIAPNTYLSRFFAFEAEPPYRIVARSGMFCLGYPNPENEEGPSPLGNPLVAVRMQLLHFAGEVLQCPRIHFVMGMVDKVGEEDRKVILSYGVSDCLSRVVEIDKSEIATMLWPDRVAS